MKKIEPGHVWLSRQASYDFRCSPRQSSDTHLDSTNISQTYSPLLIETGREPYEALEISRRRNSGEKPPSSEPTPSDRSVNR